MGAFDGFGGFNDFDEQDEKKRRRPSDMWGLRGSEDLVPFPATETLNWKKGNSSPLWGGTTEQQKWDASSAFDSSAKMDAGYAGGQFDLNSLIQSLMGMFGGTQGGGGGNDPTIKPPYRPVDPGLNQAPEPWWRPNPTPETTPWLYKDDPTEGLRTNQDITARKYAEWQAAQPQRDFGAPPAAATDPPAWQYDPEARDTYNIEDQPWMFRSKDPGTMKVNPDKIATSYDRYTGKQAGGAPNFNDQVLFDPVGPYKYTGHNPALDTFYELFGAAQMDTGNAGKLAIDYAIANGLIQGTGDRARDMNQVRALLGREGLAPGTNLADLGLPGGVVPGGPGGAFDPFSGAFPGGAGGGDPFGGMFGGGSSSSSKKGGKGKDGKSYLDRIARTGGVDRNALFEANKSLREQAEINKNASIESLQEGLAGRRISGSGIEAHETAMLEGRINADTATKLRDFQTAMEMQGAERSLQAAQTLYQGNIAEKGQAIQMMGMWMQNQLGYAQLASSHALGEGALYLQNLAQNQSFLQAMLTNQMDGGRFIEALNSARLGDYTDLIAFFFDYANQVSGGYVD